MSNRFDICWPYTLAEECPFPDDWSNVKNFSNDPHDPGGATMCGIIQSEFNIYLAKNKLPLESVHLITKVQGHDIYYTNYWLPLCPNLPVGLDLDFFDECVNTGQREAVEILQYALNIQVDGMWGPKTSAAVEALQAMSEIKQAITSYTARREAVYHEFRDFEYFGKGWEARAARIGSGCLEMATQEAI